MATVSTGTGFGFAKPLNPIKPKPAQRSSGATDYKSFLFRLRKQGNYLVLPRSAFGKLSIQAAALAFGLLNALQLRADDDGFAFANDTFLRRGAGLTAAELTLAKRELERLKVLVVEQRAEGQHVRVRIRRLERLLGGEQ